LARWRAVASLALLCGNGVVSRAALQFDVFLGYDGIVPEACWFPVVCEIKNDSLPFTGTVELSGGMNNPGQTVRQVVELPTGTLKRIVLPVFSTGRDYSWDLRLLDERGHVRAEQLNERPRKQVARGTPLVGALSRTAGGTPAIQPILAQSSPPTPAAERQPPVARWQPSIFPDNPLVLEGMTCLYLNSEKAADLSVNQVGAIFSWLNAGGHLIVAVEQPSDVSASPWLKGLFPCDVKDLRSLARHPELQDWLRTSKWRSDSSPRDSGLRPNTPAPRRPGRSGFPPPQGPLPSESEGSAANPFGDLPNDFGFEAAEMQVALGQVREGHVEVTSEAGPLIVTAIRGRGRVTALMFSPEREPARSWKNLPALWAKLAGVPAAWYGNRDQAMRGGWGSDGIFGAMIDSRQVHKLPVSWLLMLLLVYLLVIGPLDQYWLKRIGKPMLTWITFPCYVVIFSLVIYVIGYKLRAGESEWNDLHVVDVFQNAETAELRGRTYSSVYSPSNQRYTVEGKQKYATFRGEFAGLWGGGQSTEKATVLQNGDSYKAEVFVPVWASELFVSDWWQSANLPLAIRAQARGDGWQVRLENHTDRALTNLQFVIEDRIFSLGAVGGEETKTFTVSRGQGTALRQFVADQGNAFQGAVMSRQRALGATASGQIEDRANASMAVSFLSQLGQQTIGQQPYYQNSFVMPPGLDLSPVLEQGGAVLLAWAPDYSPTPSIYQFSPRRSHRDTLWRIAVAVD
jgi:hypothetical protein